MPFVIAVMMAASAGFATPIGYQTNLMVYGPGGYRFSDYVKIGVPLDILIWIITVAIAPSCGRSSDEAQSREPAKWTLPSDGCRRSGGAALTVSIHGRFSRSTGYAQMCADDNEEPRAGASPGIAGDWARPAHLQQDPRAVRGDRNRILTMIQSLQTNQIVEQMKLDQRPWLTVDDPIDLGAEAGRSAAVPDHAAQRGQDAGHDRRDEGSAANCSEFRPH